MGLFGLFKTKEENFRAEVRKRFDKSVKETKKYKNLETSLLSSFINVELGKVRLEFLRDITLHHKSEYGLLIPILEEEYKKAMEKYQIKESPKINCEKFKAEVRKRFDKSAKKEIEKCKEEEYDSLSCSLQILSALGKVNSEFLCFIILHSGSEQTILNAILEEEYTRAKKEYLWMNK